MTDLYFAYGSNLYLPRLRERVASVVPMEPACLPGHRLLCNKLGRDGSGKANLLADEDAFVWGMVYAIDPHDWRVLDGFERGYQRLRIQVETTAGARHGAETYQSLDSDHRIDPPVPFDWYKQLLVDGARNHGLPTPWIQTLMALPERREPSSL